MSGLKKNIYQKMRRLNAQVMDMVSDKSEMPQDSIILCGSATFKERMSDLHTTSPALSPTIELAIFGAAAGSLWEEHYMY